jgi:hypothetical protein
MNNEFTELVDQLPSLLEQLPNSPLKPWGNLGSLPQKGIYVFFERGHPVYVGRTNRMGDRIKEHGRRSSIRNSATFAFKLAREAAKRKEIDLSKQRVELAKDPNFAKLFSEAKERVSRMSVRVIDIDGPIIQTLFEVYAAIALKTKYNDFDTH